jgi:hypothetical protein
MFERFVGRRGNDLINQMLAYGGRTRSAARPITDEARRKRLKRPVFRPLDRRRLTVVECIRVAVRSAAVESSLEREPYRHIERIRIVRVEQIISCGHAVRTLPMCFV